MQKPHKQSDWYLYESHVGSWDCVALEGYGRGDGPVAFLHSGRGIEADRQKA